MTLDPTCIGSAPPSPPSVSLSRFLAMIPTSQDAETPCGPAATLPTPIDEQVPPRAWLASPMQSKSNSANAPAGINSQRIGQRTRAFINLIPAVLKKDPSAPLTQEAPLLYPAPRLKPMETESRAAYLTGNSQQRSGYTIEPTASKQHMSTVMQDVFADLKKKAKTDRYDIATQSRQRLAELLGSDSSQLRLSEVKVVIKVEEPQEKAARIISALDLPISRGAYRLFVTMHELATHLHAQEVEDKVKRAEQSASTPSAQAFRGGIMRRQQEMPTSYLFHCPQEFIAALVKYDVRHVRRLTKELVDANLIIASALSEPMPQSWQRKDLIGKVQMPDKTPGMYTGILYRVRLQADFSKPVQWARADFRRRYRDLERDTMTGRTPEMWMSELQLTLEGQMPTPQQLLQAVCNFITHIPLVVVRTSPLRSLQDVVYLLSDLQDMHGVQQALQVNSLAHSLTHALNDADWHLWWCKQIWRAIKGNTLGVLKAQLERLGVDAREWAQVKRLGAVFAARQRSTASQNLST